MNRPRGFSGGSERPGQPSRPLPETIALARGQARRVPRSVVPSDISADEQLFLLKMWARRIWGLLEQRVPRDAISVWGDMDPDARALVDRTFEAAAILWERDRIMVEPCRRILFEQRVRGFRYVCTPVGGESFVLCEEELLRRAGLFEAEERAADEAAAMEAEMQAWLDNLPF